MKLGSHTVLFLLALMAGGWLGSSVWAAGERGNGLRRGTLDAFIEYGAAGHVGDNTPFWQTSLRHGLSALDDNTYLRAGAFYEGKTDDWHYDAVSTWLRPQASRRCLWSSRHTLRLAGVG